MDSRQAWGEGAYTVLVVHLRMARMTPPHTRAEAFEGDWGRMEYVGATKVSQCRRCGKTEQYNPPHARWSNWFWPLCAAGDCIALHLKDANK